LEEGEIKMKVKMLIDWDNRNIGTEQEIQDFLEKSFKLL
jgi:hypothetical protein